MCFLIKYCEWLFYACKPLQKKETSNAAGSNASWGHEPLSLTSADAMFKATLTTTNTVILSAYLPASYHVVREIAKYRFVKKFRLMSLFFACSQTHNKSTSQAAVRLSQTKHGWYHTYVRERPREFITPN